MLKDYQPKWQHVYPLNDSTPHDTKSLYCQCNPGLDWNNMLVIHRAFDSREIIEQAEEIIANV